MNVVVLIRADEHHRAGGFGGRSPNARCGRCPLQGRPGARCPPFNEPVSPDRPPNRACLSSRHGALHQARHKTNGCVAARLRSTRPGLPGRTPVFTGGSCPADTPPRPRCAPSPCARLSRARTTTGTPPRPATNSGRRACPPHQGGKGGDGSLPTFTTTRSTRSVPSSTPAASPGVRRSPSPWPPHRPLQTGCGVARRHRGGRALLTGPHPPGSGPARRLRSLTRWFLAYTFSSCLPDPDRLAVPARPGVARAAPTLACVSTLRLPSASPACCDRPAAGPFHPRPGRGSASWRR
jgi:hypothetical protein